MNDNLSYYYNSVATVMLERLANLPARPNSLKDEVVRGVVGLKVTQGRSRQHSADRDHLNQLGSSNQETRGVLHNSRSAQANLYAELEQVRAADEETYQTQIRELRTKIDNHQRQRRQDQKRILQLQGQLRLKDSLVCSLEDRTTQLLCELQSYEPIAKSARGDNEKVAAIRSQYESIVKNLESQRSSLQEKCRELSLQCNSLSNQCGELSQKYSQLTETCMQQQEQLKNNSPIQGLKRNQQNNTATQALQEQQVYVRKIVFDNDRLCKEITHLRSVISRAENDLESLSNADKVARTTILQLQAHLGEAETFKKRTVELQVTLRSVQEREKSVELSHQTAINIIRSQLTHQVEEKSSLRMRLNEVEAQLRAAKEAQSQSHMAYSSANRSQESLLDQIATLKSREQQLVNQLRSYSSRLQTLQMDNLKFTQRCSKLQNEYCETERRLNYLSEENSHLKTEIEARKLNINLLEIQKQELLSKQHFYNEEKKKNDLELGHLRKGAFQTRQGSPRKEISRGYQSDQNELYQMSRQLEQQHEAEREQHRRNVEKMRQSYIKEIQELNGQYRKAKRQIEILEQHLSLQTHQHKQELKAFEQSLQIQKTNLVLSEREKSTQKYEEIHVEYSRQLTELERDYVAKVKQIELESSQIKTQLLAARNKIDSQRLHFESTLKELSVDLQMARNQKSHFSTQLQRYKANEDTLMSRLAKMSDEAASNTISSQKMEKFMNDYARLETEFERMKENAKKQYSQSLTEMAAMKQVLHEKTAVISKLEQQKKDSIERVTLQYKCHETQLTGTIKQLQSQLSNQRHKVESLTTEINVSVEKDRNKVDTLTNENSKLAFEVGNLLKENSKLSQQCTKISAENMRLSNEKDFWEKHNSSEQKGQISRLAKQLSEQNQIESELRQKLFDFQSESASMISDLKNKLNESKDEFNKLMRELSRKEDELKSSVSQINSLKQQLLDQETITKKLSLANQEAKQLARKLIQKESEQIKYRLRCTALEETLAETLAAKAKLSEFNAFSEINLTQKQPTGKTNYEQFEPKSEVIFETASHQATKAQQQADRQHASQKAEYNSLKAEVKRLKDVQRELEMECDKLRLASKTSANELKSKKQYSSKQMEETNSREGYQSTGRHQKEAKGTEYEFRYSIYKRIVAAFEGKGNPFLELTLLTNESEFLTSLADKVTIWRDYMDRTISESKQLQQRHISMSQELSNMSRKYSQAKTVLERLQQKKEQLRVHVGSSMRMNEEVISHCHGLLGCQKTVTEVRANNNDQRNA